MNIELSIIAVIAFCTLGLLLSGMILVIRKRLVSTAPCSIEINEDQSLTKSVEGGKTLLTALLEEGIAIPSPCGGKATCKQCKVQVVEGGGEILETDKATFSSRQLKEGWRLSCQCKVRNDLKLKIPESLLTLRELTGVVISNENVATFIKELIVQMPEGDELSYIPGDYLQVHVPSYTTQTEDWKGTMEEKYQKDWEDLHLFGTEIEFIEGEEEVIRAYSMASYPAEGKVVKFNIRIASPPMTKGEISKDIPWGICSSYTFGLKGGDELKLSGPYGESHMIDDGRELVFLIGGAGSSFGRSHILELFNTHKTERIVTLWYGARSHKENIYQKEYKELAENHENFTYNLVLSEPSEEDLAEGWPKGDALKTNYLFSAFELGQLQGMEEPENALYYVCGPPPS